MSNCLLCQSSITKTFGWKEFLGLGKEKPICRVCEEQFLKISGELCKSCGRLWAEVPLVQQHEKFCADCVKWELDQEYKGVLQSNRSIFQYNAFMKDVLALYKFRGDAVLATIFQAELQKVYQQHFQKAQPLIVPIPLSKKRLYERGFNQSLLLAQLLQGEIAEVLHKHESEKQSKKARRERLGGENHFFLSNHQVVQQRTVLLIDDIYTTGTTIRMAAKKLQEAGAQEIFSLTLVRS